MREFKIRASKAGVLLTNPREKSSQFSKTVLDYIHDWIKEQLYNVNKPDIRSKYTLKGHWLEDESIDKAIEWLDLPFTIKNTETFEDEYFCGTPDLIVQGVVYDIKNSWDMFTFPLFENKIPTKDYETQLQVYMHLTGCKKAVLVYTLMDTPEEFQYEPQYRYEGLDVKLRCKTFEVEYDAQVIEELKERVTKIRNYISTLNF